MDEADSSSAGRQTAATPPASQRAPQSAPSLTALLDGLKGAVQAFRAAEGRNREVREAARTMESKEPDLRRQAGDPVDPKVLSDLIHQTPEQQLIEAIRSQRQQAKDKLERAWRALVPALDRMRSSKTAALFTALSELDRLPLTANIDRRFVLVDEILAAAHRTPRKGIAQRKNEEEKLKKVKLLIKSMAAEGKTYEVICKRLDATEQPRPSTTKWGHLSYREAIASPDHRGAVKTWISRAIHE